MTIPEATLSNFVNLINREYCKKLVILLPLQSHPNHYHKIKEETFQILFGRMHLKLEGETRIMYPGDLQTILREQSHSFSTENGVIFEEVSTTHMKGDSYYEDSTISESSLELRKTVLDKW